jgi:hypothetical protein
VQLAQAAKSPPEEQSSKHQFDSHRAGLLVSDKAGVLGGIARQKEEGFGG